jgi:hypothetical protein
MTGKEGLGTEERGCEWMIRNKDIEIRRWGDRGVFLRVERCKSEPYVRRVRETVRVELGVGWDRITALVSSGGMANVL